MKLGKADIRHLIREKLNDMALGILNGDLFDRDDIGPFKTKLAKISTLVKELEKLYMQQ